MLLDHPGVSPKAPPPTLEKAIQDLQNADEDSVFACSAMLPDTKSRCNATFSLPPYEIKATVQFIRHYMPPYTTEQAIRLSRLFLCIKHSLDTEYSSAIIAGLVDTPDKADVSTTQNNVRQPRLPPTPPRKLENNRPKVFEKQHHEPAPERHDSLAPTSPPQSSTSTAALRYRVRQNRQHSVHADLEFFAAKWEVLCSDEFRCIAYDTDHSRCRRIIEEAAKKSLQGELERHVLKAPPMGILRPLLQQMLCWSHNVSEWLDAYHQKWAKHFLAMYRFGDGDGMTFLQTLEPGAGAFSFKIPSTIKVDRSCANSTGSLKDDKKSSEGIQDQQRSDNGIDKSAVNVVVASKNSKTDCRLEKRAIENEELSRKATSKQLVGEK
ncbi:hypothetical protein SLS58_002834 [Diplodia intermedia]|uniref:Uncharacterized protein n=1 Tax=Diplodia intermedia TaxID=856260 RepID=A0ABR3TXS1_9PEZI